MYSVIINCFYWLIIKYTESYNDSSSMDVDAAVNKIVVFNTEGSIRK